MFSRFLLIILFTSLVANAQDSLHVKLSPNNGFDRLMLYKIKGAHQEYIASSKSDNSLFKFGWPENAEPGIYRLFFDVQNGGFFEVIYNNESIEVTFDSDAPDETAVFSKSKENRVYQTYIQTINVHQQRVDSLQIAYFGMNERIDEEGVSIVIDVDQKEKKDIEQAYKTEKKLVAILQHSYEEMSVELMAHSFIKSSKKFNSDTILAAPEIFLETIKTHYFDYIDFSNSDLKNSSFFIDAAIEYVFYLNTIEDQEINQLIKKQAITTVMHKIGENYDVKSEIISSLLYAFAGQQEIELVSFLKKNHYEKLPSAHKDVRFIQQIDDMITAVIGSSAPEIYWEQNGQAMKLSELNTAQNYVVVFWSTSCSHCLIDIPKLYEFTKNLNDIQVLAVAIEDDAKGFDTHTKTMTNWINVLGLNKWENEFARSYDINSTPSFFVLSKDKKILAKPEELEDLINYLSN